MRIETTWLQLPVVIGIAFICGWSSRIVQDEVRVKKLVLVNETGEEVGILTSKGSNVSLRLGRADGTVAELLAEPNNGSLEFKQNKASASLSLVSGGGSLLFLNPYRFAQLTQSELRLHDMDGDRTAVLSVAMAASASTLFLRSGDYFMEMDSSKTGNRVLQDRRRPTTPPPAR